MLPTVKIMLSIFVLIFFLNCFSLGNGRCNEEFGELCFLVFVYRHGDRAPVCSYPKDPNNNLSYWPNGWGQLTKLGKHQHYELGKWIRHSYGNFIPPRYNSNDIYVQSTDMDRTLVSAYCNLAGLYDVEDGDKEDLPWVPVPVHSIPPEIDNLIGIKKHCPQYEILFRETLKSGDVCLANDYYDEVFCGLSKNSGLKIETVRDVLPLYSILSIQSTHGLTLPNWTSFYYPEPMKEIAEFAFKLPCYTVPLKRLKCGPLLKDIINNMEHKIKGHIKQKIWMYSGHDTTIANLLQCMDLYDGVIPPYTAMVIFELYSADGEYYISISYKTPTTFRTLRLPNFDRVCPLRVFKKIMKPILPEDWEKECSQRLVIKKCNKTFSRN